MSMPCFLVRFHGYSPIPSPFFCFTPNPQKKNTQDTDTYNDRRPCTYDPCLLKMHRATSNASYHHGWPQHASLEAGCLKRLWPWPPVLLKGWEPKKYAPSGLFWLHGCTASSGHSFCWMSSVEILGNVWLWRWHPFWTLFCEKLPYPVHLCLWIYKYTNIHLYKYVSFIVLAYIIAPHSPSVMHPNFTAKVHTAWPCLGHHCDSSSSARSAYPRAFTPKNTVKAKAVVVGGRCWNWISTPNDLHIYGCFRK